MAAPQILTKLGEEIQHFSHPQHPLYLTFEKFSYICIACKEYGAGCSYRCNECDMNMHEFCAKAPQTSSHPYHSNHQLVFQGKQGGLKKTRCEICGKATKGFAFRCATCSFAIHPCCSQLPTELTIKEHPQHSLKLLAGSPISGSSPYTCNVCNKKGTAWVYYCAPCDFYLHALCAKGVINGLEEQGITVPPKLSKVARAARYASQVVQIFVDGLVEGLGEGVADAIVDTISREVILPITDDGAKRGEH